jgi:hypothetical protein
MLPYHQHCLFAVVVDTGKQFFGGVVDTGDKIAPRCRWYQSEISLKFIAGVNDTAEKLFTGVVGILPGIFSPNRDDF